MHWIKCIGVYTRSLDEVDENDYAGKASIFNKIGLLYQANRHLDEALEYQKKCLDALELDGNVQFMSITYRNLGRLYTLMGNHLEALRCHQKSLELKGTLGDQKGEALSYETMAQDAEYEDDYETAIENYNKVLEIYQSLGLKPEIQRIQKILTQLNREINDWENKNEDDMFSSKAGNFF